MGGRVMELQVLQQSIPVVEFNKEELKVFLEQQLEKYKNLVVTPETEKDCKKVKTELGKLETSIETFRKETKKQLSEPITQFEKDCKELVALIQEVKKPIDTQLKEIEEQRKAEKEVLIREEIEKIVLEYGLDEKHSVQIQVQASWLNKTTSMNKIITDIKNLAETLKIAQMSVARNRELVQKACEVYNPRLKTPLDPMSWSELLEAGQEANEVIAKIHAEGQRRLGVELREDEQVVEEILNTPIPEPVVHEEDVEPIPLCREAQGQVLKAVLELHLDDDQKEGFERIINKCGLKHRRVDVFEGTAAQLNTLKSIIASTGIKYVKVNL